MRGENVPERKVCSSSQRNHGCLSLFSSLVSPLHPPLTSPPFPPLTSPHLPPLTSPHLPTAFWPTPVLIVPNDRSGALINFYLSKTPGGNQRPTEGKASGSDEGTFVDKERGEGVGGGGGGLPPLNTQAGVTNILPKGGETLDAEEVKNRGVYALLFFVF